MKLKMKLICNYSAQFYAEFLALAFIACMICPSESVLTLTSEHGSYTFTEGDYVTLKCTMSTYTNTLIWRYASKEAAKCVSLDCYQLLTGDGAFLFTFDITNKVFQWSLGPVRMEDNGKLFECYDGTDTQSFTATVKEAPNQAKDIAIAGLVIACVAFVVLIDVEKVK